MQVAVETGGEVAGMTSEICTDNRFVLIAKYFDLLKQKTNIETSHEEMQAVENILFRCWQLRWLDTLEKAGNGTLVEVVRCKDCIYWDNEFCMISGIDRVETDYCSQGQRKEGEE